TREALDFVARHASQTGYLVGDRFSIADLTAATVLFPTCLPPEYPIAFPEPRPVGWQHWLARWQGHAGCDYVRRMYREHRGTSAAVTEECPTSGSSGRGSRRALRPRGAGPAAEPRR